MKLLRSKPQWGQGSKKGNELTKDMQLRICEEGGRGGKEMSENEKVKKNEFFCFLLHTPSPSPFFSLHLSHHAVTVAVGCVG